MDQEIIIPKNTYSKIVQHIELYRGNIRNLETWLQANYGIPRRTAASIISINFVRKMKHSHFRVIKQAPELWQQYKNAVAAGDPPGILIRMAEEIGSSPALIAKILLEQHLYSSEEQSHNKAQTINDGDIHMSKKVTESVPAGTGSPKKLEGNRTRLPGEGRNTASRMLRDTSLIDDGRLASEIFLSNFYDDQYGPVTEMYNRAIGEEFEYVLYQKGKEASLSFQSEEDLRCRGYDKTPDLKLDVPIAVGNFVVNWIESKGLFGDYSGHRTYIAEQYSSYWNRFGPGLVIYWLGYEDSIVDPHEKRFIVRPGFPRDISYIQPLSIAPQ